MGVPFSAMYWFGYESFRPKDNFNKTDHNYIIPHTFAAGFISASIATVLTQPFDVVKTEMQVMQKKQLVGPQGSINQNRNFVWNALGRTIRNGTCFRGLT